MHPHSTALVHHSIRKTRVVSDDAGVSTTAPLTAWNNCIRINLSALCLQLFLLQHPNLMLPRCNTCQRRKRGWPTVLQWRRRVPPLRPHCSTGCSWMMTWKWMLGTRMPLLKPVTCLSRLTTQRSMSPPWRPTLPTESPPRSAIAWCRDYTWFPLDNNLLLNKIMVHVFHILTHI